MGVNSDLDFFGIGPTWGLKGGISFQKVFTLDANSWSGNSYTMGVGGSLTAYLGWHDTTLSGSLTVTVDLGGRVRVRVGDLGSVTIG